MSKCPKCSRELVVKGEGMTHWYECPTCDQPGQPVADKLMEMQAIIIRDRATIAARDEEIDGYAQALDDQHARIVEQNKEIERLRERVRAAEGVLCDPDKLRLLAKWLDMKDEQDGRRGTEVQDDLRSWAQHVIDYRRKHPEEKP
ncbi:MAG: hypothetical protein KKD18_02645 [Nanoarchaeota archaeon]|nr:hypothetical protein [Nanoarchaeota archaeon]